MGPLHRIIQSQDDQLFHHQLLGQGIPVQDGGAKSDCNKDDQVKRYEKFAEVRGIQAVRCKFLYCKYVVCFVILRPGILLAEV